MKREAIDSLVAIYRIYSQDSLKITGFKS
jgi:hypothetical protein